MQTPARTCASASLGYRAQPPLESRARSALRNAPHCPTAVRGFSVSGHLSRGRQLRSGLGADLFVPRVQVNDREVAVRADGVASAVAVVVAGRIVPDDMH